MIESLIEAVVKAQISAVMPVAPADLSGAWDVVSVGEVKGHERPGNGLHVSVAVAPRSFESFTSPKADIAVALAFKAETSFDPTGSGFHSGCAALTDLLQTWQRDVAVVRTVFAVEGFTPCGVRVDGGAATRDDGAWAFTQSFTVRGVVADPVVSSTTPATAT